MEQYDPISFASVISSLLLCKRVLSANEIINFTSALSCEGMDIDDEWNIDVLQPIVFMDEKCSFGLGKQFNYNTLLPSGVTVDEFLRKYADSRILDYIRQNNSEYEAMYLMNHCLEDKSDKQYLKVDSLDDSYLKESVPRIKTKKRSFLYSLWAGIR